ncbi:MAG: phenylalanine--tRNA ligase subunit beta [Nanoarchaeota archaeon]|nr:phenylalanine--tRNA ligase subunit beta [Nanoarchaeota archaeon]MBU4351587.1 phenylalanine--tRNA ligase subunit beta [Nanoarchaeota archaeon]MBU4456628.1 phenylalanine--tRNA ligase subunit beta [Nanoarchaeota archaeon]MCG2719501.1 phenylalanine--tRNA ligase subunit beta [Nanoarchaeota archaeon]
MPTISFSLKELNKLVGKKIVKKDLSPLLEYAKAELDEVNGDEVFASIGDTNLPYLWSVEGIAILLKGILGVKTGLEQLKFVKSKDSIIVDDKLKSIRPYISAFSVSGAKVDEDLLKQLIQLQEKFCHTYGVRRKKVAIGVYNYDKIKFPINYKAVDPESVHFVPLEFKREMTLGEILEVHPKGIEFKDILKGFDKYPLLMDYDNNVLSFPPIINSNYSGKVDPGNSRLFFEATGTNKEAVTLATNIFAHAFAVRGFKIHSVDVKYGAKKETYPQEFKDSIKLDADYVNKVLGTSLSEKQIVALLKKMRYGFDKGKVLVPDYRLDIMHQVDIAEDVGIALGYDNIKDNKLEYYSTGDSLAITKFIDKIRELVVGMGYQEVMSPILTNKNLLYDMTESKDFGTIEISNFMSENYSAVRSWIIPQLLELLSKNKKEEYPQRIFEEGLVSSKKTLKDYDRLAVLTAHTKSDFTEVKQVLDYIMNSLNVKYEIKEAEHSSFIKGRVGRVYVNDKSVAYIGEIHPQVLDNFGLQVPVAAFELNLTDLYNAL